MKVVDANVLLYAVNEDAPQHARARGWLDAALSGGEAVGFTWIVLLAFLRLSTRVGLFPRPLTVREALDVVALWLSQSQALVLEPTPRHLGVLRGLLEVEGTGGNVTNDAHLAAVATEHGAAIATFDRGFGRFAGVKVFVPDVVG